MIRRPPRSTLFPYTRSSDLAPSGATPRTSVTKRNCFPSQVKRSEEHTSELQSQSNLVCRLLLEKKINQIKVQIHDAALTIHRAEAASNSSHHHDKQVPAQLA